MAGLPAGVGRTAIGVAALRAAESERSDRLFADPYAAGFVAAAEWVPGATSPALAVWVAVRTRFLDELVLDATSGKCRQVVILGAGLDTRAFRLDWPAGVRVFEVDVPDVLDFKARVLSDSDPCWAAGCERVVVPADLRRGWTDALAAAGWVSGAATVWVLEGLLVYLAAEDNERLIGDVTTSSAPGSRLGLTLDARQASDASTGYKALWQSVAPDDPAAWLGSHGWEAELFSARERAAAYGRPLPAPGGPPARPRAWLVGARLGVRAS